MAKPIKSKRPPAVAARPSGPALSPAAQEMRALLRRVPDGFQATLTALSNKPAADRDRVLAEMARVLGKDVLPLLRGAARHKNDDLAASALKVMPLLASRAAADVLGEIYRGPHPEERTALIQAAAQALTALGVRCDVPLPEPAPIDPQMTIREGVISFPNVQGSQSVGVRMQDQYGTWYTAVALINDIAGVKDGFTQAVSRRSWDEAVSRQRAPGELPEISCPVGHVQWRVAQGRKRNEVSGFPLGKSLQDWDRYIPPPPEDYRPPDPSEWIRGLSKEELEASREASAEACERDWLNWTLQDADCAPYTERFTKVVQAEGYSDEYKGFVAEIAEALLSPMGREIWRDRLAEAARCFHWRKEQALAEAVAVTCADLEAGVAWVEMPLFMQLVSFSVERTYYRSLRGTLDLRRYDPMRRY